MIKNMNSKMTTNAQLSTTQSRKKKQNQKKTNQTPRTETELQKSHGDHMEGYQWGGEGEEWRGKVQGNRKRNWKVQNRWGEDKNGIGNGEAKDFICMTHRHELRWGEC